METTIFEKIIAREIPASFVYEDDLTAVFLDISPINKGHCLVIPKKKFVNIFDADPDTLAHMVKVAQKVAVALKSVTKAKGVNLLMSSEAEAGQEVFYAHIHVIPRFERGEAFHSAQHVSYEKGEMDTVAKSIARAL